MFNTLLLVPIGTWAVLSGIWWLFQREMPKPIVMVASGCGAGLLILISLFLWGLPVLTPGLIVLFVLEAALTGTVVYCFTSAVEKSEASLAASVTAFAPIMITVTAYFILGETPSALKILGILIILVGTYVMNVVPGAPSWFEPLQRIWKQRGSWLVYAITAAVAASIAIPLEKKLVLATNNFFAPGVYLFLGLGAFWGITAFMKGTFREVKQRSYAKSVWVWLVVVGLCFGLANASQAAAFYIESAAPVAALKRLDGVVAVLFGWLWLKESNIQRRLPGIILIAIGAFLIGIG